MYNLIQDVRMKRIRFPEHIFLFQLISLMLLEYIILKAN
jgi:hypothetical protein